MKKRIFALAMALAMAATAAGCGAKQSTDVEALLQKANDTMAQVTSMSAQMEVQMDMAYEEESMKSVVKSDMDLIMDPFKTNMTISMTLNDEALQTYEMQYRTVIPWMHICRWTESGSISLWQAQMFLSTTQNRTWICI